MEIQTVMVTGYWLDSVDSFIESVTIYSVGKGQCSDVMGYITITFFEFILSKQSKFDVQFVMKKTFVIGLSVSLGEFSGRFSKCSFHFRIRSTGQRQLLDLLTRCSFFYSFPLLSTTLFVIVYLLLSFLFYWSDFECILFVPFGVYLLVLFVPS